MLGCGALGQFAIGQYGSSTARAVGGPHNRLLFGRLGHSPASRAKRQDDRTDPKRHDGAVGAVEPKPQADASRALAGTLESVADRVAIERAQQIAHAQEQHLARIRRDEQAMIFLLLANA